MAFLTKHNFNWTQNEEGYWIGTDPSALHGGGQIYIFSPMSVGGLQSPSDLFRTRINTNSDNIEKWFEYILQHFSQEPQGSLKLEHWYTDLPPKEAHSWILTLTFLNFLIEDGTIPRNQTTYDQNIFVDGFIRWWDEQGKSIAQRADEQDAGKRPVTPPGGGGGGAQPLPTGPPPPLPTGPPPGVPLATTGAAPGSAGGAGGYIPQIPLAIAQVTSNPAAAGGGGEGGGTKSKRRRKSKRRKKSKRKSKRKSRKSRIKRK